MKPAWRLLMDTLPGASLVAGLAPALVLLACMGPGPVRGQTEVGAPAPQQPPDQELISEETDGSRHKVTIRSDLQEVDEQRGIITAVGHVFIAYPAQQLEATAQQAQYFREEARLVLSGDVEVVQAGRNSIRGERLFYDLDKQKLTVLPGPGGQVLSRYNIVTPN